VVRTRVGYTGGSTANPTYRDLGDHTESLQVDYDPTKTSYEKLLEVYWATPNSCADAGSRQYMSAIFYQNDAQRRLAESTRDRMAERLGKRPATAILPLKTFYLAEDYHQKFYLRQDRALLREFQAMYPRDEDFLKSTAAARVNGYLGGNGTREALAREIDGFGLSPEGRRMLLESVRPKR
jgi:methionine-S-sulfoxide reductase